MFKEFEALKEKDDADDEKADLVGRICALSRSMQP
jgi:hypothetical protein